MASKSDQRRSSVAAAMGRSNRTARSRTAEAEVEPQEGGGVTVEPAPSGGDDLLDSITASTAEDIRNAQEVTAEQVGQLPLYPLAQVAPHPFNPPERLAVTDQLRALGSNIAENGLHQPLVLVPRKRVETDDPVAADLLPAQAVWVIIAGHRRYAAALEASVSELPGLIRLGPCDPVTVAAIFLDENFHREKPDPLMEAQAFQRMRGAGLSTTEIGRRRSLSQGQVSKTLKLLGLLEHSPEVAAEVRAARMTRADAYEYLALAQHDREPVFRAWQADQESERPHSLRVHALRHSRTQEQAATPPDPESEPDTVTSGASTGEGSSEGEPSPQPQQLRAAAVAAQEGLPSVDTLRAVLGADLTPTLRADILADAALCCDERARRPSCWRALVAEALGVDVPSKGSLATLEVPQAVRRKIAVGQAIVFLEADAARYDGAEQHPPAHVQRHRQRLVDLGVL